MSKIYFTPYGVGLGHASRLLNIANILNNSKIKIRFSTFGEPVRYIINSGYECMDVPSIDFSWSSEGSFSLKNTISNVPLWFKNFSKQVNKEVENIIKFSPDLVVSDSRLSSLVAAKILNVPSILLINQIKLLLSPKLDNYKITRIYEKINGELLGACWSMSKKILVPDLPPPNTISERNTWDVASVQKKLQYIGFIYNKNEIRQEKLDKIRDLLKFSKDKPIVFFHISGPPQTRYNLIDTIIRVCKKIDSQIQYIVSEGNPSGSIIPKKMNNNGWYYEWCPIKDELFALSDIILLRGGHTSISQAIQYGKPIITVPIENHAEQLGNSNKVVKMGFGTKIESFNLESKSIENAIDQIITDESFTKKANELMDISKNLDGIHNIVNIIRSYIN